MVEELGWQAAVGRRGPADGGRLALPAPVLRSLGVSALIGGGAAYLAIPLVVTAAFREQADRSPGRALRTVAALGSYLLWIAFAQAYLPDMLEAPLYAASAAGLLAALLLRVAGAIGSQRRRPIAEGA